MGWWRVQRTMQRIGAVLHCSGCSKHCTSARASCTDSNRLHHTAEWSTSCRLQKVMAEVMGHMFLKRSPFMRHDVTDTEAWLCRDPGLTGDHLNIIEPRLLQHSKRRWNARKFGTARRWNGTTSVVVPRGEVHMWRDHF